MPAWVPNLDFPALDWAMHDVDSNKETPQPGEPAIQIEARKLRIRGAIVCEITAVPYGNTSGNNRQMWWAWKNWMDVAEPMRLVFWKTIFCDDVAEEIENDESLHWWHDWFCCELWMNLLMMDSRFLLGRDTDEQHLGRRTTSVALVRNATRHKKLFQAEDTVGIGPLGVREGDKIIMLHGYRYPFVARPKPKPMYSFMPWRKGKLEYEIVGPCYVHAVWDWDEYHDEKLKWEDLYIV